MPTSPTSGPGGGSGGPAAGSYLPTANATGVTLDTTTYADPIAGGGAKLATLVFPADQGALAIAISGDAFPRWICGSDPGDALYFGDGTHNPFSAANVLGVFGQSNGSLGLSAKSGQYVEALREVQLDHGASAADSAPKLSQLSPLFTITSGALPTVAIVSGAGTQISAARDAETVTPFTGDGTNNVATCKIELSSDNVTYSVLATISIAAALNLTGVLTDNVNVRVPAGWYLKLTATHGTLGTLTYY